MAQNKQLKILIVSDFLPYPLDSGGKICLFNFVDYLRNEHSFTLFAPSYSCETEKQKEYLNKIWPNVNIEYVDVFDVVQKKSFLIRTLNFSIRKLNSILNKLSFSPDANYKRKLDFTSQFEPFSFKYINSLKRTCDSLDFDIIQVQFTRNLNLIAILPEKPKKIFEQIESQFDVIKDYTKTQNIDESYATYLVKNSELLENSYINKYDAVFTLNNKDAEYFKSTLTHPKIFSSPFGVLNTDITKEVITAVVPEKIVFSGSENHYPNLDALEWYLKQIQNKVYEKHKLSLHITGIWSYKTKHYLQTICPSLIFEGFVADYAAFLKKSIVIVPIRIGGGGLRTKILYAMANGAPVVSTSIGAFGIEGKHKEHYYLADTETEFYDAITELVIDLTTTQNITKSAFSLISEKYSQTKTSELRNKLYSEILQR